MNAKRLTLFFLCLVMGFSAQGQSLIERTLALQPALNERGKFGSDNASLNQWASVLGGVVNNGQNTTTTPKEVYDQLSQDPFFKPLFEEVDMSSVTQGTTHPGNQEVSRFGGANAGGAVNRLLNQIGGIDVTNFADGLATFLVNRAKEELTNSFFADLQSAVACTPELGTLFPKSSAILNVLYDFQIADFLPQLQSAFQDDLKDILGNTEGLFSLDAQDCKGCTGYDADTTKLKKDAENCWARVQAYQAFGKTNDGFAVILFTQLMQQIYDGENAAQIIHSLATNDALFKDRSSVNDLHQGLLLSDFFSQSLLSSEPDQIWVPFDSIRKVLTTPSLAKIYLGLLNQQSQQTEYQNLKVPGSSNMTLAAFIQSNQSNILSYVQNLNQAQYLVQQAIQKYNALPEAEQRTTKLVLTYATATLGFVAATLDWKSLFPELKKEYDRFVTWIPAVESIISDYQAGDYSSLVLTTYHLLDSGVFKDNEVFDEMGPELLRYGTFMAVVAEADSSEQIEQAIEAFALPPGSASMKKNSRFNVAVNSYVGVLRPGNTTQIAGFVKDNNGVITDTITIGRQFIVSAPVGLSVIWGFPMFKKRSSLSLFASIIDVGALAQFR